MVPVRSWILDIMMEKFELLFITPVFSDLKEFIQIYGFSAIFQNSLMNIKYNKKAFLLNKIKL